MPLAGSPELPARVFSLTSYFDPPLDITGTQGLFLRCEYENTRDVPVTFGTAVENEMCFMWLYHY